MVGKKMQRGRVLTSALVLVGAIAAAVALPASPAAAATGTFRGSVVCDSKRPVVGVWVESSDGGSGWASFTKAPGTPQLAYFSKSVTVTGSSTAATVTVGCGGTPSKWASSNKAPAKSVTSAGYVYNTWCSDPKTGNGSCRGAQSAKPKSANTFGPGWCTDGAARMWRKATGQYPSWMGNAKDWDNNAKAQGYKVVGHPRERSVAVWEGNVGGGLGHVAFVTKVWVSGSSIKFHIIEMNGANGKFRWTERDITYGSGTWGTGVDFIIANSGAPITKPA